jgi:hypothetical protein
MTIFVSLPFHPGFDNIYTTIKTAANNYKLMAYKANEEIYANMSVQDIIEKEIRGSSIFIADVTGGRPNVLNEIGQAQALGKPIILISQESPEKAPFNIRNLQIKQYPKNNLKTLTTFLHQAFSITTSFNETLRQMLVPGSLERQKEPRKFVISTSPYRRSISQSEPYNKLRNTSSDYVGLRGILQLFGLLYGFNTLPDIVNPEDCTDRVLRERMTIYSIGSPKANRWTGQLIKDFCKQWKPHICFKADPGSPILENVWISLCKDGTTLYPKGWKFNTEGDRCINDFGIIIRGPNPYHEKEMMVILAGRSSLGTEAACRAFTKYEIIDNIRNRLSAVNVNLEDHTQGFWALVKMSRLNGDRKEEASKSSLELDQVDTFQ